MSRPKAGACCFSNGFSCRDAGQAGAAERAAAVAAAAAEAAADAAAAAAAMLVPAAVLCQSAAKTPLSHDAE